MSTRTFLLSVAAFLVAISSGSVIAQTMEESPSLTYEAPFGQSAANSEMIASSSRDQNFNKIVTTSPGWQASSTAIGNLVNVVAQGSNNTIVVNASQVNSGSQRASVVVPGAAYSQQAVSETARSDQTTLSVSH